MGPTDQTYTDLARPERVYYANTATYVRRGKLTSFVFAQFTAGRTDSIQSAMGFDMHVTGIAQLVSSFKPEFLELVRALMAEHDPMPAFPREYRDMPKTSVFPAHLVQITLSDLFSAIDFYALSRPPQQGADLVVEPLLRIRCFVPVAEYFVSMSQHIAKGEG